MEISAEVVKFYGKLARLIGYADLPLYEPHLSPGDDGGTCLTWCYGDRSLYVRVWGDNVAWLKVWGHRINEDMEEGHAPSDDDLLALWKWLIGQEST